MVKTSTLELSAAAKNDLESLLKSPDYFLRDWLVAASGKRIPEKLLAKLLDLGSVNPDFRPSILPALGDAGVQLAMQKSKWLYAVQYNSSAKEDLELLSRSKILEEKVCWFQLARKEDHQKSWDSLLERRNEFNGKEVAALLSSLSGQLSAADEPNIELLLNDKDSDVSLAAADSLANLPNSPFVERLFLEASAYLALNDRGLLETSTSPLESIMGTAIHSARFKHSLISYGAPRPYPVPRDIFLFAMLGFVPPVRWQQHFSLTARQLIFSSLHVDPRNSDVGAPFIQHLLINGFELASVLFEDADFASLLIEFGSQEPPLKGSDVKVNKARLVKILSPIRREQLVTRLVQENNERIYWDGVQQPILETLKNHETCWTEDFSRTILLLLKEQVPSSNSNCNWLVKIVLPELGKFVHPAVFDEASTGWKTMEEVELQQALKRFISRVELRRRHLENLGH